MHQTRMGKEWKHANIAGTAPCSHSSGLVGVYGPTTTPEKTVTEGVEEQEKHLKGVVTKIGKLLTLTPPKKKSAKKRAAKNSLAAASEVDGGSVSTTSSCSTTAKVSTNGDSAPNTVSVIRSPHRTRKGVDNAVDPNAATPRKGRVDSNSTRPPSSVLVSRRSLPTATTRTPFSSSALTTPSPSDASPYYSSSSFGVQGRPTTDFLGWRRRHPHEIVRLRQGDFVIITIPANAWRDDKIVKQKRDAVKRRAIDAVLESYHSDFRSGKNKGQKRQMANSHLERNNGIQRNGSLYIELPCVVKSYPKRDELSKNAFLGSDLKLHINSGGGIEFELLDYPCSSTMLLKWNEVNHVQIFSQYFRGDSRPLINLPDELAHDHLYCDELDRKLDVVKDDVLQTLELALAFERRKTAIRNRKLKRANTQPQCRDEDRESTIEKEFKEAVRDELADQKLTNFAISTDLLYKDAWTAHNGGFAPNLRLLTTELSGKIFDTIEKDFPLHFQVFRSLVFSERAHQPARRVKSGYAEKKKALVNHFLALVRVRHPSFLIHSTLACESSGSPRRSERHGGPSVKETEGETPPPTTAIDTIHNTHRSDGMMQMQTIMTPLDPHEEALKAVVNAICVNCAYIHGTGGESIRKHVHVYRPRYPGLTAELVEGGLMVFRAAGSRNGYAPVAAAAAAGTSSPRQHRTPTAVQNGNSGVEPRKLSDKEIDVRTKKRQRTAPSEACIGSSSSANAEDGSNQANEDVTDEGCTNQNQAHREGQDNVQPEGSEPKRYDIKGHDDNSKKSGPDEVKIRDDDLDANGDDGFCNREQGRVTERFAGHLEAKSNGAIVKPWRVHVKRFSAEGCTNQAVQGDFCIPHGAKKTRKLCDVEGCAKQARRGGVCARHSPDAKCSVLVQMCGREGCWNKDHSKGVCFNHGLRAKMCTSGGCTNQAQRDNVCIRHGAKVPRKLCEVMGCANRAKRRGVCVRHGANGSSNAKSKGDDGAGGGTSPTFTEGGSGKESAGTASSDGPIEV